MDKQEYLKTIRESLEKFWKPGQKLAVTGPITATGDEGICCMLCNWPLTGEDPQVKGLKNVYILTNTTTGESITIGSVCRKKYQKVLEVLSKPKLKAKSIKIQREPYPFYDDIPDEELEERTLTDEEYVYYFLDDDWADIRDE
ncbi:MAG TPA: hypothetical protein PKI30_08370 [Bacillota bacterium]|nr:hypothetical protein [Bacillota bacterium]